MPYRLLKLRPQTQIFLHSPFDKTRDVVKPTIFTEVTEYGLPKFGSTDIELFQNPLQRPLTDYESYIGGSW